MYLSVAFFLLCAFLSNVATKNELYTGHKIYNFKFTSQEEQDLSPLKNDEIDILRYPSFKNGIEGRVMVPASQIDWFEKISNENSIEINIFVDDVFQYLQDKDSSIRSDYSRNFDFNGYHRYEQILEYLDTLQDSNNVVEVLSYGVTEENRTLVYVKVSNTNETEKPVIIVEAGINPREWITIPAAINIINKLLDGDNARFLDSYDWIIIPVVNPDGYEYTHTSLRLWAKTLTTSSNLGFICPGVNVNRNFDIDWLISGSSGSPCSYLYGGPEPFSEIESQLIRSLINDYGSRVQLYVSLQNNGPYITYPWNYEKAASGMFIRHHMLALDMISAAGSEYNTGVGSITLDSASGTSSDYAQRNGIPYSFIINIKQDVDDGIIIPGSEIVNAANIVWEAIAVAADKLL